MSQAIAAASEEVYSYSLVQGRLARLVPVISPSLLAKQVSQDASSISHLVNCLNDSVAIDAGFE